MAGENQEITFPGRRVGSPKLSSGLAVRDYMLLGRCSVSVPPTPLCPLMLEGGGPRQLQTLSLEQPVGLSPVALTPQTSPAGLQSTWPSPTLVPKDCCKSGACSATYSFSLSPDFGLSLASTAICTAGAPGHVQSRKEGPEERLCRISEISSFRPPLPPQDGNELGPEKPCVLVAAFALHTGDSPGETGRLRKEGGGPLRHQQPELGARKFNRLCGRPTFGPEETKTFVFVTGHLPGWVGGYLRPPCVLQGAGCSQGSPELHGSFGGSSPWSTGHTVFATGFGSCIRD